MAHSRLWRIANCMGLVEDPQASPRAGTKAWWLRLVTMLLVITAVAVIVKLL